MSLINTYTKKAFRLDYGVWIVMLVLVLLCLGLLGYKLANEENCTPDLIHVNGSIGNEEESFTTSQLLTFSVETLTDDQVEWSFGDRSGQKKQGATVTYQFKLQGNYEVKALIKNRDATCEKIVMISIRNPVVISKPKIALQIVGESYSVEGEMKVYSCNDVSNAYLWRLVGAENSQTQNTPSATFKFPATGEYTIELMLNNDPQRIATKSVTVINKLVLQEAVTPRIRKSDEDDQIPVLLPREKESKPVTQDPVVKPPSDTPTTAKSEAAPVAAKKIDVLPETFKAELDEVIALKKTPEELAEKYLFYGASTKVRITNSKNPQTGFLEFCYQMRNNKKLTLESVSFDKDASGITVINVEVSKKGFVRRLLKKN